MTLRSTAISAPPCIIVLTAPRSGSSWLASLLRSTGCLGVCREWLTSLVYPAARSQFGPPAPSPANRAEFVAALRGKCATDNGVAAVKLIGSTLDQLPAIVKGWGIGDGRSDDWITDLFPDPFVVVLRRCDRIGRAISWWRATQTGEYALPKDGDMSGAWPTYEFTALQRALRETDEHARRVDATAQWLAQRGVRMLEVPYERMIENPEPIVRAIAALMEVPLPEGLQLNSELSIQRNDLTEEVRAQLLSDLSSIESMPTGATAPHVSDDAEGVRALGHRTFVGGDGAYWDAIGDLQFQFLRQRGLKARHVLLDLACGSLRGGTRFIPYLEPGNYLGFDRSIELVTLGITKELGLDAFETRRPRFIINGRFDLSEAELKPDYVIAQSLFTHLIPATITAAFRGVAAVAKPTTQFFATYLPRGATDPANPSQNHSRLTFKYTPEEMQSFATAAGWFMTNIGEWGHPRQQHIALFTRKPS